MKEMGAALEAEGAILSAKKRQGEDYMRQVHFWKEKFDVVQVQPEGRRIVCDEMERLMVVV